MTDLSDQETVAVLKHEIAKLTNVRPERQKLLNLKHRGMIESPNQTIYEIEWFAIFCVFALFFSSFGLGKNAADDLRLSALELKPNFKLMMVGSLEADIQDVQNSIDNRDVIDDFDDDNDERTTYNFHKMEVCI